MISIIKKYQIRSGKHKSVSLNIPRMYKIKYGYFPIYRVSPDAWSRLVSSYMNSFLRAYDACKHINM